MNEKQSFQAAIFLASQSIENFENYFKDLPIVEDALQSMFNISESHNASISEIFLNSKQRQNFQNALDTSISINTQKLRIIVPNSSTILSPSLSTPKLLDYDSQLSSTFSYQKSSSPNVQKHSPARKIAQNANLRLEVDNATRQSQITGTQKQIEGLEKQMQMVKDNIAKKDVELQKLRKFEHKLTVSSANEATSSTKQQQLLQKQIDTATALETTRNTIKSTIFALGASHPDYQVFPKGKWTYDLATSLFSQLLDICDQKIYESSKFANLVMQQQIYEVQADIEPHLQRNLNLRDQLEQQELKLQEMKLKYHDIVMNQYK